MSETPEQLPPLGDPDEGGPYGSRRHALWVILALGCVAAIVSVLMVLLGTGSGSTHDRVAAPGRTPITITTPTAAASSATPTTGVTSRTAPNAATGGAPAVAVPGGTGATTTAPTTTVPATPARTGDPCTSAASCVVAGDGGAIAAANAFRTKHGLDAVPGSVTAAAQTCALNKGTGQTCVPHYAWTAMSSQDGADAITKIAGFNRHWLLDKTTKDLSVGWAYVDGQYECVLLKAP